MTKRDTSAFRSAVRSVRAAADSLQELEGRLRAEAKAEKDLEGYLESLDEARRSVAELSKQLESCPY